MVFGTGLQEKGQQGRLRATNCPPNRRKQHKLTLIAAFELVRDVPF